MELHNFDPEVVDEIYKTASINLSPNVPGQVALGLMVNPPKIGDASYKQYRKEKDAVLDTLKIRAKRITDAFNALEGVVCQNTDGNLPYTLLSTLPLPILTPLINHLQVPCTPSLASPFPQPSSRWPRPRARPLMCCTAWSCWRRPACHAFQAPASSRSLAPSTSAQPSW